MMNTHSFTTRFCLLIVLMTVVLPVSAAENDPADKGQHEKAVTDVDKAADRGKPEAKEDLTRPVYVPPRRGDPLIRVGGSTRGSDGSTPFVIVVTPEQTGITGSRQPELYWYLSKATRTRFRFVLVDDLEIEPIMEITSDSEQPAGFNHIDLAEHGITLEPGVVYQWSVALVQNPAKRSSDMVSTGQIEFIEMPTALQAKLAKATRQEAVHILARAGYWYDTFTRLSRMIAANPGDPILRNERAALLEQVGLAGLTSNHPGEPGSGTVE
jgi:hypothetical protein